MEFAKEILTEEKIIEVLESGKPSERTDMVARMREERYPLTNRIMRLALGNFERECKNKGFGLYQELQFLVQSGNTGKAAPTLIGGLAHKHYEVRELCATGLGSTGDGRALMPLMEKLAETDGRYESIVIINALGLLGDQSVFYTLMDIAEDEKQRNASRSAAIFALGRLGDERAAPLMLRMLSEGELMPASMCLRYLGVKSAVPALMVAKAKFEKSGDYDKQVADSIDKAIEACRMGFSRQELHRVRREFDSLDARRIRTALGKVKETGIYQHPEVVEGMLRILQNLKNITNYDTPGAYFNYEYLDEAIMDILNEVTNPEALPVLKKAVDERWDRFASFSGAIANIGLLDGAVGQEARMILADLVKEAIQRGEDDGWVLLSVLDLTACGTCSELPVLLDLFDKESVWHGAKWAKGDIINAWSHIEERALKQDDGADQIRRVWEDYFEGVENPAEKFAKMLEIWNEISKNWDESEGHTLFPEGSSMEKWVSEMKEKHQLAIGADKGLMLEPKIKPPKRDGKEEGKRKLKR